MAVRDNRILGGVRGFSVQYSQAIEIADNDVENVDYGMLLFRTEDIEVTNNTVKHTPWGGLRLNELAEARIANNTLKHTSHGGIEAERSPGIRIENNTVYKNHVHTGIVVLNSEGAAVRGNTVDHSRLGMAVGGSEEAVVRDNHLSAGHGKILWLKGSYGARLEGNVLEDGGAIVDDVENARIANNTLTAEGYPTFLLEDSTGLQLEGNTLTNAGLRVRGEAPAAYEHEIDASNTVNGDPIRYVVNETDPDVASPAGQVVLVNTTGALVEELTLANTTIGLQLTETEDTLARNNTLRDNRFAALALETQGDTWTGNRIVDNHRGLRLEAATSPRIEDNRFVANDPGLSLVASTQARLQGNAFVDDGLHVEGSSVDAYDHEVDTSNTVNGDPIRYVVNGTGHDVTGPAGQVVLANTTDARVEGLRVANTTTGLRLAFTEGTQVSNNTLEANDRGLHLSGALEPTIRDNALVGNRDGALVAASTDVQIHQNNIHDNEDAGLRVVDPVDLVNATGNWWGHASGPSSWYGDGCTGEYAHGDGDTIAGEKVCFDPWLTSPNPTAGAE